MAMTRDDWESKDRRIQRLETEADQNEDRADRWKDRYEKLVKKAEQAKGPVIDMLTIGGTAAAIGGLKGYMGERAQVMGASVEGVVALMAHGFAFAKPDKNYSGILHNVGNGALALFAADLGHDAGQKIRRRMDERSRRRENDEAHAQVQQPAAASGYWLPPPAPYALPAATGATPAADRAMADAIAVMRRTQEAQARRG